MSTISPNRRRGAISFLETVLGMLYSLLSRHGRLLFEYSPLDTLLVVGLLLGAAGFVVVVGLVDCSGMLLTGNSY